MAKACNCASLGLAFTAIGLFFMLLWASGQAVPASVENSLSQYQPSVDATTSLVGAETSLINEPLVNCSSPLNNKLCKYVDDDKIAVKKRMKHRNIARISIIDNSNELAVKSSKNSHERQVRSLSNKFSKGQFPNDKHTFAQGYDNTINESYELVRNISFDERINKVMNNGVSSVSMESLSDTTLATLKASDVKANVEKEASDASDKYFHVNGESTVLSVISISVSAENDFASNLFSHFFSQLLVVDSFRHARAKNLKHSFQCRCARYKFIYLTSVC